jgi:TonB family protein
MLTAFCDPVYPRELLDKEVKGEVAVRVALDAQGRVATGEILSATHPELGAAFLAAVETWRFAPAQRRGAPTPTVIDLNRKFLPFGFRRPVAETQVQKKLHRGDKAIVGSAALDRPLRPLYRVEPQYPRTLIKTKEEGEAVVEFLIHESGQVVLPQTISATRPEFGWAAVTAVQQWVFEKPLAGGKGVTVRHRIAFGFSP